ncbi:MULTISPECIES: V-type ATP synthase subunit B [Sphaerochaeta]|jgi:V/A-type H+-transporting ATPase subunit B|uniref:V-type sodium ATPase subunit B n=1 Tax=bioreactor metagenome TaxID=1076179 RepID=A0A644VYK9_9ZZZZ|nr:MULTISPECIES: V-type ATP synthase subunit B [Sphaerochaeta]MDT3359913.1 V-type ATP synthase subunit B [Spirochaetota bacterium]MDD2394707.1 V-type ATP synthase subunit B [Sphaerochaeta sp.]MDD3423778.1 V-type ATP synthase subunit B [Sphaerochaeta sp.]MDD3456694.1 V-type ATP synthase subunit B [Sphaerochaeta sp.]MDD4037909.1 V-type ATP synthase subunit B [Sphaerochaeta sp.]
MRTKAETLLAQTDRRLLSGREYRGVSRIDGPLVYMRNTHPVGFGELVEVIAPDGSRRSGQVLDTSDEAVVVQVFEGTDGLTLPGSGMRFMGEPLTLSVSEQMLGRVMNGLGKSRDGSGAVHGMFERDVNGEPINPTAREYPRDFIQTGISVIDGMTTLIQGQKLPIFSGNGLDHNQLAAQIARQAKVRGSSGDFCIVFAAMGVKYDVARFFIDSFEETGVLDNVALFLSLADDPSIERTITPKTALTLAEYLAFDKGKQVLVIMTDMTNYCESLREIGTMRGEIPSRKGYPGYLYSNLAEIYERSGKISGRSGSITQLPILSMPNDDISHPVPDLTGYITEGQIVFERGMQARGIYPPINCLPSLSRLMKDGIGEGMTRGDHPHLANQLFASYSHVKDVQNLASVIGEEELTSLDQQYLEFGSFFEKKFVNQGFGEDRSIEQTLDLGWEALSKLPSEELQRLTDEEIAQYYGK